MSDRRCGYCALEGHIRPKCPLLITQHYTIRKFVAEERIRIHKKLMEWGAGTGSIFQYQDENGEAQNAIIPSHDFIGHYVAPEYQNMRRSKKCRATIHTIDRNATHGLDLEKGIYTHHSDGIYVHGYPLHDMSRTVSALFYIGDDGEIQKEVPHYYWRRPGYIVSPSDETDIKREHIMGRFRLAGRLTMKGQTDTVNIEPILDDSITL